MSQNSKAAFHAMYAKERGEIRLTTGDGNLAGTVSLFDNLGRLKVKKDLLKGLSIGVSDLPNGIYVVQVFANGNALRKAVTISR